MSVLDIRDVNEAVDEIVFAGPGGSSSYYLQRLEQRADDEILTVHWDNDYGYLRFSDIDNLIAALRKAKELWSK